MNGLPNIFTSRLDAEIRAVAPIVGVSIGRKYDRATWRIDFADEATKEEREAAAAVLAAFDADAPPSDEKRVEAAIDSSTDSSSIVFKTLLDLENRLRTLEGKSALNESQWHEALEARLAAQPALAPLENRIDEALPLA